MSPSAVSSSTEANNNPHAAEPLHSSKKKNNQHHSVVSVLPPRIHIPARLHTFLSAWQSVDATMQNRLAGALKNGEESMYTSVLVLSLGSIPVSSTVVGAAGPAPAPRPTRSPVRPQPLIMAAAAACPIAASASRLSCSRFSAPAGRRSRPRSTRPPAAATRRCPMAP